MDKLFKLKENNTTIGREVLAGLTTFFAMSYILVVNPQMLGATGMPVKAVFLATIFASIAGTLVMALFANVPYAQAPGMGLNAFFTFTVVFALGFSWQQALAMVFLCGIINIIITVTRVRKMIIKAIPVGLQNAIGGGIGIFIAYIGLKGAGLLTFTADPGSFIVLDSGTAIIDSSVVPALVNFTEPALIFSVIALLLTIILVILKVPGAIFISIIASTIIGIFFGVTKIGNITLISGISESFSELGTTFGAAFGASGMQSLFSDISKLPTVLMTIFAFSLSDTFDTLGTFIGTGRRSGIFDEGDMNAMENSNGFKSKMDRALFADSIATSVGALFGTSNTTTFVESAAGIGAGGRTGLTSVVTAAMFFLSIFLAPVIGIVPTQATAPALIIVGIMMLASFKEVDWSDLTEAVPCFFASIFMGFSYSISYGIAAGFITYVLIKLFTGKAKEITPIIWVVTALFITNFVVLAML